ncbi:MAG TPA: small basic protein [Candidatus Omnitrophota bacterium]|nr:small basic protein [Candidatus Omnitrophota bacterium]
MSLHPSLRIDKAAATQKTVLTRIERIKDLMKNGFWVEGQNVTRLPKTKVVRLKTGKKKKEEAPAEGAAAPAAGATAEKGKAGAAAPKAAGAPEKGKAAPAGKK